MDGLNFLSGKPLAFVAEQAMRAVILAHVDGGVPNVRIEMPASVRQDCRLPHLLLRVCLRPVRLSAGGQPLQPARRGGLQEVNMFALLGKPGYEEQKKALEERL